MAVKLENVAELAGVSKTTVSRVLNNRGYISSQTRKKVHDAIEELHYSPNAVARQLFKKETKLVGLIFPSVDNPFFSELVAELEKRLFKLGFKVLIGNSMNDPEKERIYLKELIANQVDGLIVGAHNSNIEEYKITNLPIVAIDRVINDDVPIIASDNYQGGKLATELLIKKGAKNIIVTDGPLNLRTPAHDRRLAYEAVMKKNNLVPKTFIMDFSWDLETKRQAIKKMFEVNPQMDAVFATNDADAALIWQIAKRLNIRVPEELKIIGYDRANSTRILLPELSSVEQPIEEMADKAVKTLVKKTHGEKTEFKQVVPVSLWKGQSV